jgi:hypothetical protein
VLAMSMYMYGLLDPFKHIRQSYDVKDPQEPIMR